jgi:hypothetical protein
MGQIGSRLLTLEDTEGWKKLPKTLYLQQKHEKNKESG